MRYLSIFLKEPNFAILVDPDLAAMIIQQTESLVSRPKGNTETSILYIPGHLRGILRESLGALALLARSWDVMRIRWLGAARVVLQISWSWSSKHIETLWGAKCCMFFFFNWRDWRGSSFGWILKCLQVSHTCHTGHLLSFQHLNCPAGPGISPEGPSQRYEGDCQQCRGLEGFSPNGDATKMVILPGEVVEFKDL